MQQNTSAFSFLELILVIALLGILTTATTTWISRFFYLQSATMTLRQIQLAFSYARSLAILHRDKVTICPSHNGVECANNWNVDIIVFTPKMKPRSFRLHLAKSTYLSLQQSGFANKKVDIQANGMTYTNGHFTYKSLNASGFPQFNLYFNKAVRFYASRHG